MPLNYSYSSFYYKDQLTFSVSSFIIIIIFQATNRDLACIGVVTIIDVTVLAKNLLLLLWPAYCFLLWLLEHITLNCVILGHKPVQKTSSVFLHPLPSQYHTHSPSTSQHNSHQTLRRESSDEMDVNHALVSKVVPHDQNCWKHNGKQSRLSVLNLAAIIVQFAIVTVLTISVYHDRKIQVESPVIYRELCTLSFITVDSFPFSPCSVSFPNRTKDIQYVFRRYRSK